MALPPTIPTSFVPHTSAAAERRYKVDFIGVFGFISYAIFVVSLVLAVGVFLYGQVLSGQLDTRNQELKAERDKIDEKIAQNFVRLDDRLTEGKVLLDNHIALSNLFKKLNVILPLNVRFSSLQITDNTGSQVALTGSGVAKTFNALAYASAKFAEDVSIKNAIFSRITVNKDNSVSFALSATVDRELVLFSGEVVDDAPVLVEEQVSTTTTP